MPLRFHEISEGSHRILNPFTPDKYRLLAEICELNDSHTILDIACGKGEMLCQWANRFKISGVGVDLSSVFLSSARLRSEELNTTNHLIFVESEGAAYLQNCTDKFDIVCCIGATWIGNGLEGTIDLLKPMLRTSDSLLVIGEPFWHEPAPEKAIDALSAGMDDYTSLERTLERFESAGFDLYEMVMANRDNWDRYEASQWKTGLDWLRDNPDDPDAASFKEWITINRKNYLTYGRRYFGWGVFVLKRNSNA